jgi:SAM-dependent methyltransferase
MELARLSDGEVVGVDSDVPALAKLGARIEGSGLQRRVSAINASFFAVDFADGSFDVLWDEGMLHLFDPEESLPVCRRLLRPDGFLVMNETVLWLESVMAQLGDHGFDVVERIPLPPRSWWTDYYALLEARIQKLRAKGSIALAAERLAQLEGEIAIVKADPQRFDCCFLVLKKD